VSVSAGAVNDGRQAQVQRTVPDGPKPTHTVGSQSAEALGRDQALRDHRRTDPDRRVGRAKERRTGKSSRAHAAGR
jgi:hypothetical protein